MRRLLMTLLTCLLVLPVAVLTAPAAHACSCAGVTPAEQLAAADLVVEGRVTAVTEAGRERTYTLAVTRSWRGSQNDVVRVRTKRDEAECGTTLSDDPQIVLARASGETWTTGLCDGRVLTGDGRLGPITAQQVESELGQGTPSGVDVSEPPPSDEVVTESGYGLLPWILGGAAVLLGGLALLVRRRGHHGGR